MKLPLLTFCSPLACSGSLALWAGSFNFLRKVIFHPLLKEEQDLYQMVEIVPLVSTVTGG
jgi:hypothetical protein